MAAQVVEYLSGSPERSCAKSLSSVNTCWKLLLAATICILVVLRKAYVSSILVSLGSLNTVIFAIFSRFACGQTLLYLAYNLFHFSLTIVNSRIKSLSSKSMQKDIVRRTLADAL